MSVLDVAPQEYKIDNTLHVEPVGVAGRYITGQFLNIVARASLKKNLEHSFEQAKVEIADDLLVAPTALAQSRADRKRDAFRLCTGGLRCRHHHRAGL